MNPQPEILLGSFSTHEPGFYRFEELICDISACNETEVVPALRRIDEAVHSGSYAVGFIAYEAAAAFDPSLSVMKPKNYPLLWFGIYRKRQKLTFQEIREISHPAYYKLSAWQPELTQNQYRHVLGTIKEYIAAGDCYQVNYTFQQHSDFHGDPRSFFLDLCRAQSTPYSAFFDLDELSILSTSPELFFQLDHGVVTVRPMKGTAGRGKCADEDRKISAMLSCDEKERAENLMIVDLLRNDLGRISENGSVTVTSLFDVETLPTVHQMTSSVSSHLRSGIDLVEIFRALFPCGSITGAPKKRSMEIIEELENSPRGIYTGCIGYIAPKMSQAVFSVAIRTIVIDKNAGTADLGVGSGITWYSSPDAEFEECQAKGLYVKNCQSDFSLIESLLFEQGSGFFLLERHLKRLAESARYFGFTLDLSFIQTKLVNCTAGITGSAKVRLELARDGSVTVEYEPLVIPTARCTSWVTFANQPVDSSNIFLYHKTSKRELYRVELAKNPECVDVIFVNERNEVTEGANNNLAIRKNGVLLTPPISSGLLPGTLRAELLEKGEIVERLITPADLEQADEIYLINSVRKWRQVHLVKGGP